MGIKYLSDPIGLNTILTNSYQPVTNKPISLTLNLSSPDDNKLVFKSVALVEGTATPNSLVVLSTNSDDQILKVSPTGSFSQTINLDEGVNQIMVSAFDNTGNSKQETRMVYYSKEEIK